MVYVFVISHKYQFLTYQTPSNQTYKLNYKEKAITMKHDLLETPKEKINEKEAMTKQNSTMQWPMCEQRTTALGKKKKKNTEERSQENKQINNTTGDHSTLANNRDNNSRYMYTYNNYSVRVGVP